MQQWLKQEPFNKSNSTPFLLNQKKFYHVGSTYCSALILVA
jgi:hypothetical protein